MNCSSNHTSPYTFTYALQVVLIVPPFLFNVMDSCVVHTLVTRLLVLKRSTVGWLFNTSMFIRSNSCQNTTLHKQNSANDWLSSPLASLSASCTNWTNFFCFSFVVLDIFYVHFSCPCRCFLYHHFLPLCVCTVGTNMSLISTFMTDGTFSQSSIFWSLLFFILFWTNANTSNYGSDALGLQCLYSLSNWYFLNMYSG